MCKQKRCSTTTTTTKRRGCRSIESIEKWPNQPTREANNQDVGVSSRRRVERNAAIRLLVVECWQWRRQRNAPHEEEAHTAVVESAQPGEQPAHELPVAARLVVVALEELVLVVALDDPTAGLLDALLVRYSAGHQRAGESRRVRLFVALLVAVAFVVRPARQQRLALLIVHQSY
jgi:hypothetical protein